MKPTNYHLFDYMDFDPELKKNESLWKAYKPTALVEKDGDILVPVPFQKQVLANDMAPDTNVAQETHTLIIRQYEPGIIRLFMGFDGEQPSDTSEMLQMSARVKHSPLHAELKDDQWVITDNGGVCRAVINMQQPCSTDGASCCRTRRRHLTCVSSRMASMRSDLLPTTISRHHAMMRCRWATARRRARTTVPHYRSNAS